MFKHFFNLTTISRNRTVRVSTRNENFDTFPVLKTEKILVLNFSSMHRV